MFYMLEDEKKDLSTSIATESKNYIVYFLDEENRNLFHKLYNKGVPLLTVCNRTAFSVYSKKFKRFID